MYNLEARGLYLTLHYERLIREGCRSKAVAVQELIKDRLLASRRDLRWLTHPSLIAANLLLFGRCLDIALRVCPDCLKEIKQDVRLEGDLDDTGLDCTAIRMLLRAIRQSLIS